MLRDLEAFLRYVTLIAVRFYLLTYFQRLDTDPRVSIKMNSYNIDYRDWCRHVHAVPNLHYVIPSVQTFCRKHTRTSSSMIHLSFYLCST